MNGCVDGEGWKGCGVYGVRREADEADLRTCVDEREMYVHGLERYFSVQRAYWDGSAETPIATCAHASEEFVWYGLRKWDVTRAYDSF